MYNDHVHEEGEPHLSRHTDGALFSPLIKWCVDQIQSCDDDEEEDESRSQSQPDKGQQQQLDVTIRRYVCTRT